MKNLITSALLGLVLVAGTASAEKVKLMEEELDTVNAGVAIALGASTANAAGVFLSFTSSVSETAAVSIPGFISLSGSSATSTSIAF